MAYANLPLETLIVLAAEFVGRGHSIPAEIAAILGPSLLNDIHFPQEVPNDRPAKS